MPRPALWWTAVLVGAVACAGARPDGGPGEIAACEGRLEEDFRGDVRTVEDANRVRGICATRVEGDVLLDELTPEALRALARVRHISGSLRLGRLEADGELPGLPELVEVTGGLSVDAGSGVPYTFPAMPALARVGGDVRLRGVALADDALPALGVLDHDLLLQEVLAIAGLERLATVSGDLRIASGSCELHALSGLVEVGSLALVDCRAGDDLSGLESLEWVGGDLTLVGHRTLTSLAGLPDQLTIGGERLVLADNPVLRDLSGLPHLTEELVYVHVERNAALTDVAGLAALDRIQLLVIGGNPSLERISIPGGLGEVYTIQIEDHPELVAIEQLGAKAERPAKVRVLRNPSLRDVSGIASRQALSRITLEDNPALVEVVLDWRLRRLATFEARGNPRLVRVAGPGIPAEAAIQMENNGIIEDLSFFSGLRHSSALVVADLATVKDFAALRSVDRLAIVGARLDSERFWALEVGTGISLEGSVSVLPFPSLTSANSLRLVVDGPIDLAALERLERVGTLRVTSPTLTSLAGMEALVGVEDALEVSGCDALVSTAGLAPSEQARVVRIVDNGALADLSGLAASGPSESLEIHGNGRLPEAVAWGFALGLDPRPPRVTIHDNGP